MEGGELFHQIVKLTYFSENLSRHVVLQVAHGIHYLHEERGVVHRDIKPENLLFERIEIVPSKNRITRPYDGEKEDEGEFIPGVGGGGIGRVKIADFGLSKVVWNEETMTPCGTVGYTAPEIVKDERYSKSVDMWALGCVLYTLLCGFPPFYDESIQTLTEKVAKGHYTFLSPWWDDVSLSGLLLLSQTLQLSDSSRSERPDNASSLCRSRRTIRNRRIPSPSMVQCCTCTPTPTYTVYVSPSEWREEAFGFPIVSWSRPRCLRWKKSRCPITEGGLRCDVCGAQNGRRGEKKRRTEGCGYYWLPSRIERG